MKSIIEYNKQKAAWPTVRDAGKQILTYNWIFTKWYEKLILAAAVLWGMFSILKLLF